MKIFFLFILISFVSANLRAQNQLPVIDNVKFFTNDTVFDAVLSADMGKLLNGKMKPEYIPATFSCKLSDSSITGQIRVIARGNMRRQICYMPPLKLDFHTDTLSKLYTLNSLKLVCGCKPNANYEQLLLKEYLVYKIYNLLTEKSYRVRLLNLDYEDSRGKKKTISQHAFFIEDAKDMAKRNDCKEWKKVKLNGLNTDRNQMTVFAIFEYMIGNTDWGISANHNSTLILSKKDSAARPFAVPYDFDYSGLVDADYAVPNEGLDIEKVTQRLYRGYPRTMQELDDALKIFRERKEQIYSLISNFELLTPNNRQTMKDYLDDFYKTINDPREVKYVFIDNARKQ
ncbi:MAG TPA: hypothetical protein PLA68_09200 [Panacibacter sp.]|nr:hypothetical protein [Panacibacter sp.]